MRRARAGVRSPAPPVARVPGRERERERRGREDRGREERAAKGGSGSASRRRPRCRLPASVPSAPQPPLPRGCRSGPPRARFPSRAFPPRHPPRCAPRLFPAPPHPARQPAASRRSPSPRVARGLGRVGAGGGGGGEAGGAGGVGGRRGRLGGCERGSPGGPGGVVVWVLGARGLCVLGVGAFGVGRVVAVGGASPAGPRFPPPRLPARRPSPSPPFQVPSASRRGGLKTPRGPPVRPGSGAVGPLGSEGGRALGPAGLLPTDSAPPPPPLGWGGRREPPGRLWGGFPWGGVPPGAPRGRNPSRPARVCSRLVPGPGPRRPDRPPRPSVGGEEGGETVPCQVFSDQAKKNSNDS